MGKRVVAIVVGAVVAVALVVGGVVLAGGNGRRTPATLPALDVSSPGAATAQSAAPSAGPGTPDSGTESRISPSGRVQYLVRGTLPDLPRSAKVWTLPDQVTRDRVAQLARALGIAGEPTRSGQTWTVTDGTRRLFVNQLPGGPWTMTDGRAVCAGPMGGIAGKGGAGPRIITCPAVPPFVPSAAAGRSGSAPVATTGPPTADPTKPTPTPTKPGAAGSRPPVTLEPPRRVPLPDRATVERIARDLFARTSAPADGLEVQFVQGFDRWSVSALPRVGGVPTTGYLWTAGIGAKGQVLSATGWLDSPRAGDTYPLISVQEALQRLRNRQVGGPIVEGPISRPCARAGLPSRPSPGGCDPAKPLTFQVTDVRLGLQLATALSKPNGGAQRAGYLAPAYQFQLDGSWQRQVSVIAVQDRFLSTTPKPTAVPLKPGG
ncbi:MAG TPA: hypothetical protein VGC06_23405 [Actinomycetes bacterium]